MTRLLIGFFFGLMVAGAVGQTSTMTPSMIEYLMASPNRILAASAIDPAGSAAIIKVDAEGRVICSPESPK